MDPGPEVLPNLSPYLNGRVEADGRPPCPSPSIVAQTGYYLSDLSCPIGPHTWRSALRSTHSAVAAADHVAAHGGAAYALCRPSGHHAHRDRAGGFCYLNSSAPPQPGCGARMPAWRCWTWTRTMATARSRSSTAAPTS